MKIKVIGSDTPEALQDSCTCKCDYTVQYTVVINKVCNETNIYIG